MVIELGAPSPVVLDDYVDSEGITVPLLYEPAPPDMVEGDDDMPPIVRRLLEIVSRQQETIVRLNGELTELRARGTVWDELRLGIEEMEHEQQQRT